jgi:CubicO group peptidase (beta-lactamase class C family)
MSLFNDVTSARINSEGQQILSAAGTPQCVVWGQRRGVWQFRKTFRLNEQSTSNGNDDTDHVTTYCIGSISKILVATATIILLDQLAQPEDSKYKDLHDAWKDSISKHLDIMVRRLSGPDTTISELLYHFNGLPSINDFILGPDGTVLMSKQKFLTTANKIIQEIHAHTSKKDHGWRYNNGGYILAGLLIEHYSELTLGEFLKQTLFIPLGMNYTYATTHDFEMLPEGNKAAAHVVSFSGRACPVQRPRYFDETILLAAAGIYSCTKDLAIFSQRLLDVLAKEDMSGYVNVNTASRLFYPRWVFGDGSSGVYTYCGYKTTLDTTKPGSHSPNRVVSPAPSKHSCYTFGVGQDQWPVEVIYHGGSVTGYECSFYLLPNSDAFVIALSNATGLVDASDHISRLLLQELLFHSPNTSPGSPLKQKEPPEQYETSKRPTKKQSHGSSSLPARVNIVAMARGGAESRRAFLRQYEEQTHHLVPLSLSRLRTGYYVNRDFRQSIFVEDKGDNTLAVYFGGDGGVGGKLKLLQTSDNTATVVAFAGYDNAVLGNDILGDWKCLDFKIGRDSQGKTVSLSRNRADNLTVVCRYAERFAGTARGIFPFDDADRY